MKKLLALLLALTMVLSLGVAAFALDDDNDKEELPSAEYVADVVKHWQNEYPDTDPNEIAEGLYGSLRSYYLERGFSADEIEAVVAAAKALLGGSEVVDDGGGKDLAYRGPALNQAKKAATKNECTLVIDGKEVDFELVDIANADTLDAADKEAFLAAYEAAKKITAKVVKYFFWVKPSSATLAEGQTADFNFTCEGTGVAATMNSNEVPVVAGASANAYTAKLTEFGALAILCDVA